MILKTIGIDLDGVLADFTAGMVPLLMTQLLSQHSSVIPLPTAIPTKWNWSDLGASKKDVSAVWERIRWEEDFFFNLPPLPGVLDLKAWLPGKDVSVVYITSRPQTRGLSIELQSKLWLSKYLNVREPKVVVVSDPSLKNETIRFYHISHYLDDFAPTVIMAKYVTKAYLLAQNWNRYEEAAYSIPAVETVGEFLKIVEES